MMRAVAALGMLALVVVGSGSARADKCIGLKVKAIGKKESALLACQSKVATKPAADVQPLCDAKTVMKFNAKFDRPGVCGAPSANMCAELTDACRDQIRAALPDGDGTNPSSCEATRLKAAGKKAGAKLGCYAKAASKSTGVDSTCLAKADVKFSKNFSKVTGCAGDGQLASIESLIDTYCVDALVTADGQGMVTGICPPSGSTSTTMSATTSTTSTSSTDAGSTTTSTTTTTATTGSTASSSTTTSTASTTTTSNPPTCDICAQGPALDPGCDPCAAIVCNNNPSCCTDGWNDVCVGEACTFCNTPCAGTPCGAPSCTDTMQNGNETDVDCGGGECPTCGGGKTCLFNADCTSGTCTNNQCE